MTTMGRHEYLRAIYARYRRSSTEVKGKILDEFCRVCDYHRKHAIRLLHGPRPEAHPRPRRPRGPSYGRPVIQALAQLWEAAGYPWSVRLKAMLPLWLPWLRQRLALTPELERQLRAISPRQIDRRLLSRKRVLRRRLYGRTKPGTLLKHHIPITELTVTRVAGSAIRIGPGAGQADRRTVAQLDQEVFLTTLQDLEDLALEGMVSPCHGDLVRRTASIVIRSVC